MGRIEKGAKYGYSVISFEKNNFGSQTSKTMQII